MMHRTNGLRVTMIAGLSVLILAISTYVYLYFRWQPILAPAAPARPYQVEKRSDSILSVVMIGDSWAGLHHEAGHDTLMADMLERLLGRAVSFVSKGRGGAKSKEVYRFMFRTETSAADQASGYCTQELIASKPDYCIVMAGINDAAACLGTDYYIANYKLIISWLLSNGIRPVVVEMPDVNLHRLYANKPLYDKTIDRVRACMTGSELYEVRGYRTALLHSIHDMVQRGEVVYVQKDEWNVQGFRDERHLYMDDEIHLNSRGYWLLDSCVAEKIAKDSVF